MDLTSRAVHLAEDSAAVVEALRAKLPIRKVYEGVAENGITNFGTLKLTAPTAVIVTFSGTSSGSLAFNKHVVVSKSLPPIVAILPPGTGELQLSLSRTNARALLI